MPPSTLVKTVMHRGHAVQFWESVVGDALRETATIGLHDGRQFGASWDHYPGIQGVGSTHAGFLAAIDRLLDGEERRSTTSP